MSQQSFVVKPYKALLPLRTRHVVSHITAVLLATAITASAAVIHPPRHNAKTSPAPASPIDPTAMEALKTMGSYLRTLQAFQVQATLSTDDVMEDGEIVASGSTVDLLASKPNHFRMKVTGDEIDRLYLYDGKNFTIWGGLTNYFATVPAPPSISELVQARFLLAVPLLLMAEGMLGPRLARAASHFVDSGLVPQSEWDHYDEAVRQGLRWRDSGIAELVLYLLSFCVTVAAFLTTTVPISTWYALESGSRSTLTWAGWWLVCLSIPVLQFLALRWLWRLFLWGQFLWRMLALSLQLMPMHPDAAGGLAFVGESERFFGVVLFAYSAVVSGVLANSVVYGGTPLKQLAPAVAVYVVFSVTVVLAPLLAFVPTLWNSKRSARYSYSTLALRYTAEFHNKWILHQSPTDEPLLGSSDIQSLADLGNSFAYVERMSIVPMGARTPIHLAVACVLPMTPLLLTMMPLDEIIKMALKLIL